jgi:CHAT domain-containing protein
MEDSNTNKNLRVLGFAPNYDKLFPLFSTTKEVKFIEKSFKSSICFYDDQANKKAFIDHCRNSDIIHIASHADINAFDDDYSYIAFSDVHYDNEGDYLLYLRELVSLDLNAELIVLSACNTSLGSYKKGEGILSLARGFVSAGCSSIVSSLWEVDDASTQELMESFYSHLLLGEDKSLALANAKRSYLKTHTGEKLSPYFWGGFVALGDMKPICTPNNGIKYAVCGSLFLGFLFFFRRKLLKPFSAN